VRKVRNWLILGLVSIAALLIVGCSKSPVKPVTQEEGWEIELPPGAEEVSLKGVTQVSPVLYSGWDSLKPRGGLRVEFFWNWGECPIPVDWQSLDPLIPGEPLVETKVIHRYQGEANVVKTGISMLIKGAPTDTLKFGIIKALWFPPDTLLSSPASLGDREWFRNWEGVGEFVPSFVLAPEPPGAEAFLIDDPYWASIKNYKIYTLPE